MLWMRSKDDKDEYRQERVGAFVGVCVTDKPKDDFTRVEDTDEFVTWGLVVVHLEQLWRVRVKIELRRAMWRGAPCSAK